MNDNELKMSHKLYKFLKASYLEIVKIEKKTIKVFMWLSLFMIET